MTEADALDYAQVLIHNWLYLVAGAAALVIGYFRLPPTITWVKENLPKLKSFIPTPSPKTVVEETVDGIDVIVLINQMVESLPVIKDVELHKKAVEACVAFSEAVIREAGLVVAEE